MTPAFIEAVKKGLISLLWRVGAILVAGILALLSNSIGLLNVSPTVAAFIGLVLGEITKQFNTWEATKVGVAVRQ